MTAIIRSLRSADHGPTLVAVVTADRGLCGAFNTNVIRRRAVRQGARCERRSAGAGMAGSGMAGDGAELLFVGRKAWDYFRRRPWPIIGLYRDFGGKLELARAQEITDDLIRRFVKRRGAARSTSSTRTSSR